MISCVVSADSNLANISVDKLMEKSTTGKDEEKDMDESNENSKNDVNANGGNSSKQLSDDEIDNKDRSGEKEKIQHSRVVIKQFEEMYTSSSRENIHLHQTITILQEKQHIMSLKVSSVS